MGHTVVVCGDRHACSSCTWGNFSSGPEYHNRRHLRKAAVRNEFINGHNLDHNMWNIEGKRL